MYLALVKKVVFLFVFIGLINCGPSTSHSSSNTDFVSEWTLDSLPEIEIWETTDSTVLEQINLITTFSKRLRDVQQVNSIPDLKMLIDELLEKEIAIENASLAPPFDKNEINSRLMVIRTYLRLTQSHIENEQELKSPLDLLIDSNNALQNQLSLQYQIKKAPKVQLDEIE